MNTNIVMQLKLRAVSKGVSLSKVCDMAGINRGVLSHWAKKEPKTLTTLRRINEVLDTL
jgi:transcriptional regulator with XRE-family HTH domain